MMDKNALILALRDTAQSASNAIASNISGPVDLIAAGLRAGGLPINTPVGGSQWMAEKGLTRDVEMGVPRIVGETLGMAGPAVAAAKAPQIASGLMRIGENAMAPSTLNAGPMSGQRGAVLLKPIDGPHYSTQNLAEYSPKLYRETSIDNLSAFGPNSYSQPLDLWFANDPANALGQGANKGVMIELDALNVPGQLSLSKPMAKNAYESGYAEFITRSIDPSQLGKNITSVTIDKSQQSGPYFRRALNELKQLGLSSEKMPDGSLRFYR